MIEKLSGLPAWQYHIREVAPVDAGEPLHWSGTNEPPPVGAVVTVRMNGIGQATVVGYFAEAGYLGLLVRALEPPAWLKKQNPEDEPSCVFGIELA